MKVLVCIPCLQNGGTEVQTLSLVEALVAAGHEPVVACYFEHEDSMVERYCQAGAYVILLSPGSDRPNGTKATVKFLWKNFKQIIREVRPDVAHVQYMAPGAIPILLLKLLGVPKIIVTTHTAADIYGRNGLRLIKFLTYTCIDAFQCITLNAEKGYFGASSIFNGTLKRHFTIYNALPSHISIADKPKSIVNNTITVGVVSRLAEIKGMDLVIPAFEKALERDERLKLLIVGDGDLRQLMESQAVESRFSSNIEFVGMKPQEELQEWYDKIDILLMPSRSEGFGLTALEGMARGCVPVVANVGGLPEVVNYECGYIHTPEDIDDISTQIIRCLSSLKEKREGALKRVHQFSSTEYNNTIKDLYSLI